LSFVSKEEGLINRRKRNEGRLDHPARSADRVKFKSDFGRRFAVFIDTEEEFDWTKPRSREAIATSAIRYLPEFQRLMDAHGICPTYLIDYPVANNPQSAEILSAMLSRGNCKIGTQLHAWVNPPFEEEITPANSFVGNLPIELERAKLSALTQRITQAVGIRPTIYRAGRYGVGPNSAQLLEEAGYLVDVSVRPHFDYSNEGGPNFLRHSSHPFWAGPNGKLLELPLGVSYTGQLRRYGRFLYGDGRSNLRRISGLSRAGMLSRIALTPEDMPVEDAKRAIDTMLDVGHQFLSFSFHSPSLTPGHTPYVRNSADLTNFYGWWDKILTFLALRKITPVSADETLSAAQSARITTA
jgi:hypothetical protein